MKEILDGKLYFLRIDLQVNTQKTTVKKKISYFLKNYVAALSTFFEKVTAFCRFFTAGCLDVRF